MQNLRVNQPPPSSPQVLVIGGNVNGRLCAWLRELGISDFAHAAINVTSISPKDIQASADYIRREYGAVDYLFSVGLFADKTLRAAQLDHGALPATKTKDQKTLETALNNCRNYLLRRMYHAPTQSPPNDPRYSG
jgi:hypothetical protein